MKIYASPEPDVDLPYIDILTLLFESTWCLAQEETIIHADAAQPQNCITKRQARDVVRRVAHVLRHEHGIGAAAAGQDVVLCTSSNSPFLPVLFYGVVAAGGVFSGASTAFTVSELVRQIKDADGKLLVSSEEYLDRTVEAARMCGIPLGKVMVLRSVGGPDRWTLCSADQGIDVLNRGGRQQLEWRRLTDRSELQATAACLLYSSGTTGLPKGVRLSHWNLLSSNICSMRTSARFFAAYRERRGREFEFRTVAHLPMAHIAGIQQFSLNPFYLGGTTYWMPRYSFEQFVEYSKRYQTTHQFTVPPIWLQIAKSPKVVDQFESLEVAITGAAPMGPELVREASAKLGKGRVILGQTWGTTETDGSITASDWTSRDESGSVGHILANVQLRIIDENGEDVEEGHAGELLVRGPVVSSQGYHNNATATHEAFRDGFYHTGDIGLVRDGMVYIVDRKKELIKYKGLQVAPAELEALLISHAKIADAAVIGVQSEALGTEVPKAFVVLKAGDGNAPNCDGAALEAEIQAFVKKHLASHKQLRGGVELVEQIPKSASGKILRKELRQRAAASVTEKAKL